MLANFHMRGNMLLLRAVLNILVRNASPRGPMCFRGLMFHPVHFIYLSTDINYMYKCAQYPTDKLYKAQDRTNVVN